jgi:hypothetical protein
MQYPVRYVCCCCCPNAVLIFLDERMRLDEVYIDIYVENNNNSRFFPPTYVETTVNDADRGDG